MSKNEIKYGIIGAGHLGNYHAQQLSKIKNVKLMGIYDVSNEVSKIFSQKYNIKLFEKENELYDNCDAVSICTPASVHFKNAAEALESNCHLFIEKPITNNINDGQKIIELNKKIDKIIQIGHIERFNMAYINYLKNAGEPLFIECHRLAPYNIRGLDVPVVLDLMIHDIDLILAMTNSNVSKISASGAKVISKFIDLANARIEFENGCVANITSSRISEQPMRKMRIFEKNSYSSLDFQTQTCKKISLKNDGAIDKAETSTTKTNALFEELNAFIECIKLNKSPAVNETEGLNALEIAIKIQEIIEKEKE